MNSSFLYLGQLVLGCLALEQAALLVLRYGVPRDTVRVLGVLSSLVLAALFLTEGIAVFGVFPIFFVPSIYGILMGVLAFSLPAFTYLGLVDHPSQIQRKVMWRLPIIGGLLGHFLAPEAMLVVLLGGGLSTAGLLVTEAAAHRYGLRLVVGLALLAALAHRLWVNGWWWETQLLLAWWILLFNTFLNAYMVKNLARKFVPVAAQGAAT